MQIPYEYGVDVYLKLIFDTDTRESTLMHTDLFLNTTEEQNKAWKNSSEMPNAAGVKIQSQALTLGLITSINYAHQNGLWDSAEHLRFIINELEKAFVEVAKVIEVEIKCK